MNLISSARIVPYFKFNISTVLDDLLVKTMGPVNKQQEHPIDASI